jgi:peptide methionine sulfoxide reductase msrA/msrB
MKKYEKALFASGCFWGTQYCFEKTPGVIETKVGYSGGTTVNPSYEEVCRGKTGHVETVEVCYDPSLVSYEELAKLFFETHDPTQINRQGPDIGSQYRSVIFYEGEDQKQIAERLKGILIKKGLRIATSIEPAKPFYPAEDYHQKYYERTGGSPYCHIYRKLF